MYLKMHLTNLLEFIFIFLKRVPMTCHYSQLKHDLSIVRLMPIVLFSSLRRVLNKKFNPPNNSLEERLMILVQNNNEVKNEISTSAEEQ